jgi:hypothetical protein
VPRSSALPTAPACRAGQGFEAGDPLRALFAADLDIQVIHHIPRSVPLPPEVVTGMPVWGVKDSGEDTDSAPAVVAAGREVLVETEDDLAGRIGRGAAGAV